MRFHMLPRASTCFHALPSASKCSQVLPRASTCFHALPSASTCFHVVPCASTWFHALPRASSRVSHTWPCVTSLIGQAMEKTLVLIGWIKSVQIFSLIWSGFVAFLFLAYLHICNFRDLCSAIIRNNYYNFRWKPVRRVEWVRHHGGVKDQWVPHAQTRTRQWQAVSCWTFIVSERETVYACAPQPTDFAQTKRPSP